MWRDQINRDRGVCKKSFLSDLSVAFNVCNDSSLELCLVHFGGAVELENGD